MKYDKLIRDKIPDIIKNKGEKVEFHVGTEEEYVEKLKQKLTEEVGEFLKEPTAEELADVIEVLEAIARNKNINWQEMLAIKDKKAKERGGFNDKIILDES